MARIVKNKKVKMQPGGTVSNSTLTPMQTMRRNLLTKRSVNLDKKGTENWQAGNKEKAFKQFDKSDKLIEKRSTIRPNTGYKKGGKVKAKTTMKKGGTVKKSKSKK